MHMDCTTEKIRAVIALSPASTRQKSVRWYMAALRRSSASRSWYVCPLRSVAAASLLRRARAETSASACAAAILTNRE
jgi:hypothetical protein